MKVLSTLGWEEYSLLDSGNGYRLEQFGKYLLRRPDPQIIWQPKLSKEDWGKADIIFDESATTHTKWIKKNSAPEKWEMTYGDIRFFAKLTPFKHTGIFPEQILQWDWIKEKIKKENRQLNILNLFAYTGVASLVAASLGAKVTHVDASSSSIAWARENQTLSNLQDKPIRWILDDAIKFTQREVKRGVKYDGILMDPPIYGHGPHKEVWDFHKSFPQLMSICKQVLSSNSVFLIVNAYAISSSALMLENVLKDYLSDLGGEIESGELALEEKYHHRLHSTGIFARWSKE